MEYPSLDKPKVGAFRFNTDSSQLEIYDGNQWTGVLATSPEQQTGGTRALFAGGRESAPAFSNKIEYVNIDTTGNFIDFGDLTEASGNGTNQCGCGSRTRGLTMSGAGPVPRSDVIDFITMSSTGDATDFGN